MGCFEEENEEGIHLRDRNEADERSELNENSFDHSQTSRRDQQPP